MKILRRKASITTNANTLWINSRTIGFMDSRGGIYFKYLFKKVLVEAFI